jgi:hypothetical protein
VFREILAFYTTGADDRFTLKIILVGKSFIILDVKTFTTMRAVVDKKICTTFHDVPNSLSFVVSLSNHTMMPFDKLRANGDMNV